MLITAVSIQYKDFTIEYRYKGEARKLQVSPLRQNSREIVINKPYPETVIEFTAYVTSTGERALVNGQSTHIFRSRAYRKKAFIIVGEKLSQLGPANILANECRDRMVDILFIIDNSGTMEYAFTMARQFVKKVTHLFKLSRRGTRASVITIGDHRYTNLVIRFSDYYENDKFDWAIDNIKGAAGQTRIDAALKLASTEAFKISSGARLGVPKLIFFLSDGRQEPELPQGYMALWKLSNPLHRITRNIISIAVTGIRPVDIGSLQIISRTRNNCYHPENLKIISSDVFARHIFNKFCRAL